MPHSYGLRARTRDLFQREFRNHGPLKSSIFLTTYRVGEIVDIKANANIHKGMPFKFYHGRTGRVWNVTRRAVGVEILKKVGNRYINKRLHVRIEHIKKSKSRDSFLARVKQNEILRKEAKAKGVKISLKRQPGLPRPGEFVKRTEIENIVPLKYEFVM
eukprot:TRINITY_DN2228_c0_g1_i1.p1 TRINITY_DN2228_c0_g1~~TRINITY_DN2228_c0_g1_i1.p1  ORF type:complete len:159 (+),score=29.68 TRINITY_DN2228_c0_g1_i1:285-761(+)